MGTRNKKLYDIAIASYQLTNSTLSVSGEVGSGGALEVKIDANASIADEHNCLDKDHPYIIQTKISIVGRHSNKDSTVQPEKLGDYDEKIFSLSCSARGIFEVTDDAEIDEKEILEYVNYLAPQVYLPLREHTVDTLSRMGVRVQLPFKTQYSLTKGQPEKQ